MENQTIKKLLTTEEACEILGVSHVTLRKIVDEGGFRFVKVGVQNRIDQDDLTAYIEKQKGS